MVLRKSGRVDSRRFLRILNYSNVVEDFFVFGTTQGTSDILVAWNVTSSDKDVACFAGADLSPFGRWPLVAIRAILS